MTPTEFRQLTTDERHRLALGAASVFERTALVLPDRAAAVAPTDQALAVLRTWIQAFSPGNPEAFERRLTWDELTLTDVARALSAPPVAIVEPDWLRVADAIAVAARATADARRSGPLPERALYDGTPPLPFFDLLVPVLRAAQESLDASPGLPTLTARVTPAARAAFERLLLKNTATAAELAFFEQWKRVRDEGGHYDDFVMARLDEGLVPLFLEYPVLARQLAVLVTRWSAGLIELADRLAADAPAIGDRFARGVDPGPVVAAEPGLSDPHHGGRRVAVLAFASGLRVVYKPRSLALDRVFGDFLTWLHVRGLQPAQRLPALIDAGDYGWVEYVDQEPFTDVREVAAYYRRTGALICLTHVLRARDLHMENVVATREGPVLIDLEMLIQPVPRGARTNAPRPAAPPGAEPADTDSDAESCLTTGLVTLIESNAGQFFDIGGLRGTGEGVSTVTGRAWHDLDQDTLHFTDEKTFTTRVKNQVVLDGVPQPPEAHAGELLAGFDAAYQCLLTHRVALLADSGPIAAFAPVPIRLLPRPTTQYASLTYLLARPQYQKDGCRWSAAIDALNRFVSQAHDQPDVWPVLVAERRAIEALDVPHFTALASETAVRAGPRLLVEHYYGQSGLDAVRARLRALSPEDARVQRERIELALAESIHTRFATEPQHAEATELDVTSPDFLVDHAVWIARELLVRAEIGPSGLTWARPGVPRGSISRQHHLYDGTLGPAVFMAATAVVSADERWRVAALDVVSGVAADLDAVLADEDGIGVASGLGSIVYGLTTVAALLGDAATLDLATRAAGGLTRDRIAEDRGLDLVAGAAGAALGLLALHKVTRDPRLLDLAVSCGDRLLATASPAPPGLCWRIADGRAFTGFAHGAAGIAYALGRLFDATGDRRFGRAATEGYRYVASRFVESAANWPISGDQVDGAIGQASTMTAWCHGAPGITLAISLGSADTVDPHLIDQLEPALKTTATASPHKADHVCCGNVGRCEALFTTGRRLMRRDAIEGGRRLARIVIARARAAGHFCLSANGFEYRMFDPGFFRGLSGIGYSLLRLASPSSLPSIAAFEAPPVGRSHGGLAPPGSSAGVGGADERG